MKRRAVDCGVEQGTGQSLLECLSSSSGSSSSGGSGSAVELWSGTGHWTEFTGVSQ